MRHSRAVSSFSPRASRRAKLLVELVEAVSFVMNQKMLSGIRDRADRHTTRLPASATCSSLLIPHAHASILEAGSEVASTPQIAPPNTPAYPRQCGRVGCG